MKKTCLNGYWDILLSKEPFADHTVPATGWISDTYQVPSYWTKDITASRKIGTQDPFKPQPDKVRVEHLDSGEYEFLYDAFQYPGGWNNKRNGWVRKKFVAEKKAGHRYFIDVQAVTQYTTMVVNGKELAENRDPSLPFVVDVTDAIINGENELALLLTQYDRDERRRVKACAAGMVHHHAGVWQDVWFIERSDVYVEDVTIRTSTREKTIAVTYEIRNCSLRDQTITVTSDVADWKKRQDASKAVTALTLPEKTLTLKAGERATWEISVPFEQAIFWQTENPKLYWLRTTILENGKKRELHTERFGFREIWIDGPNIMLNGFPLKIFSDWGHRFSHYHLTEGWVRKWYGMIRDGNMNHSRLHVHPHPSMYLDIADEEGIMITDECALYGSGMEHACDWPPFWDLARDHVRRLVKRDKNHPCLVMYSVENEMRWNRDETPLTNKELPQLRLLFNELDPTRPAYHEGDSSLWDERKQDITSRHYGRNSFGTGWWDKSRPLHVGEMSLYHYQGPNNTLHLGGDKVFARYQDLSAASAEDTALCIEAGRALGICAFGPWNLSCLENMRMERERAELTYDDISAPGCKPRIINAHAAEFIWWKPGKGYTPFTSFNIQKNCFRPFAIIDHSQKSGYTAGSVLKRDIAVVNDTYGVVSGELLVTIANSKAEVFSKRWNLSLSRGAIEHCSAELMIPKDLQSGYYTYSVVFTAQGKKLDAWKRTIAIAPRLTAEKMASPLVKREIAVFGKGSLREHLSNCGAHFRYIEKLDSLSLGAAKVLIVEQNALTLENAQGDFLKDFVNNGGRVIVLEQTITLFPSLALEKKQVVKAFVRVPGHPLLKGIREEELFFWGEDPYTATNTDSNVANFMYRKNDAKNTLFVCESGEGGFGNGNLEYTPLFEHCEGKGLIIACQLRVTDKLTDTPAAEKLLVNMLVRADRYRVASTQAPLVVAGNDLGQIGYCAQKAKEGATVIVNAATPEALACWSKELSIILQPKKMDEVYQVVRVKNDPVLAGVSNEDTCGIETWTYAPPASENFTIGEDFIEYSDDIEPLLEVPNESCLKELFVKQGLWESMRAFTVTQALFINKSDKAIGLGRITTGSGTVLFNQFNPPTDKKVRFTRLLNRLVGNCGGISEGTSLFDGTRATAQQSIMSHGHPREMYAYNGTPDPMLKQQMLDWTNVLPVKSKQSFKEVVPQVFFMSNDKGVWKANGFDVAHDIYIQYHINSPTSRKNELSNLGIINPEVFTFMDCFGDGVVELIVNGQTFEPVTLEQGEATVSDISLEQGENRILVRWKPLSVASSLQMKWRNIMREPEVGFMFGCE